MSGKTLGRYRVEEELGAGGVGEVYRARDLRLDRPVALKFLRRDLLEDAIAVARFRREAIALAQVAHPCLVRLYAVGEAAGRPLLVMEYLEGRTLQETLRAEGPLRGERAARLLGQVLSALEAVHRAGVVHRDVKSANVMLTPEGRAVLMDFGLAKPGGAATVTEEGAVIGTPEYMSPEQVRGAEVGPRSDWYSFGVLIYEMMTGQVPFRSKSCLQVLQMQLEKPAPALTAAWPEAPPEIASLVARCLEKDPERRYADGKELAADLLRALPSPEAAALLDRELAATVAGTSRAAADSQAPTVGQPPSIATAALTVSQRARRTATIWWPAVAGALLLGAVLLWMFLSPRNKDRSKTGGRESASTPAATAVMTATTRTATPEKPAGQPMLLQETSEDGAPHGTPRRVLWLSSAVEADGVLYHTFRVMDENGRPGQLEKLSHEEFLRRFHLPRLSPLPQPGDREHETGQEG